MGEVYRARDTRLDRDVALEILPELFAAELTGVPARCNEGRIYIVSDSDN